MSILRRPGRRHRTRGRRFLTALRSDERARARLRTEVRLARQIAHPERVPRIRHREAHGELYLLMEFVDG
jgi:hypothetical protein